jgi:hypothetical protein
MHTTIPEKVEESRPSELNNTKFLLCFLNYKKSHFLILTGKASYQNEGNPIVFL